MTTKHTPGPWSVGTCRPYIVAKTTDGCYMASCTVACGKHTGGQGWPTIGDCGIQLGEAQANAELIAAAPDLLEGCRAGFQLLLQRKHFHSDSCSIWTTTPPKCDCEWAPTMNAIEAAIAKAEGQRP